MMSLARPILPVPSRAAVERAPERRQIDAPDLRQHQVLLVGDADLALAAAVGEIGDELHLLGACSRPACWPGSFSEMVTMA